MIMEETPVRIFLKEKSVCTSLKGADPDAEYSPAKSAPTHDELSGSEPLKVFSASKTLNSECNSTVPGTIIENESRLKRLTNILRLVGSVYPSTSEGSFLNTSLSSESTDYRLFLNNTTTKEDSRSHDSKSLSNIIGNSDNELQTNLYNGSAREVNLHSPTDIASVSGSLRFHQSGSAFSRQSASIDRPNGLYEVNCQEQPQTNLPAIIAPLHPPSTWLQQTRRHSNPLAVYPVCYDANHSFQFFGSNFLIAAMLQRKLLT